MYTPQFSDMASITVRRLAWSMSTTMPKAMDRIVQALPAIVEPGLVCLACKDKTKCHQCAFNRPVTAAEKAWLTI